jgi:anaerobic ribonucleoside-triphosphate reductase
MNITVKGGAMSPEEKKNYADYITQKFPNCNVTELELTIVHEENGDEFVDMKYVLENKPEANQPIQRLRRITGYIVPNLERWNDGKRAELADRVKHGICPGDDTNE